MYIYIYIYIHASVFRASEPGAAPGLVGVWAGTCPSPGVPAAVVERAQLVRGQGSVVLDLRAVRGARGVQCEAGPPCRAHDSRCREGARHTADGVKLAK